MINFRQRLLEIQSALTRAGMYSRERLYLEYNTGLAETGYKVNISSDRKAFGYWQMEYATAQSLLVDSLPAVSIYDPIKDSVLGIFDGVGMSKKLFKIIMLNEVNSYCRDIQILLTALKYKTIQEALPAFDDTSGQAIYWKENYNTSLGAGTIEHFIQEVEFNKQYLKKRIVK